MSPLIWIALLVLYIKVVLLFLVQLMQYIIKSVVLSPNSGILIFLSFDVLLNRRVMFAISLHLLLLISDSHIKPSRLRAEIKEIVSE